MNCNGGAFFAWISTTFVWRVKGGLKGQRIGPAPRHSTAYFWSCHTHKVQGECWTGSKYEYLFINESLCPVMNAHRCRVWFCTGLGMACRECLYVGFPIWIRGVCWDYVAIPYFGISLSLSVLASRWPGLLWSCSFKTMTSLFCMWLTGCSHILY